MSLIDDQRALVKCLKRLIHQPVSTVLRDKEFQRFHADRNRFNDYQVTKLVEQPPYYPRAPIYKDNLGRTWVEETIGVKYHVPAGEWLDNLLLYGKRKKERFSRKFLLDTSLPGYSGATSEMVVARSGQRIVSGELMETFNFGEAGALSSFSGVVPIIHTKVTEAGLHYKFDIAPHEEFGHARYKCYPAGPVTIVDLSDLIDQAVVRVGDLWGGK